MMYAAERDRLSYEAAERAARDKQEPFIVWPEDLARFRRKPFFPFPFIGAFVPRGWEKTENVWFVDISGFGADDEPALSAYQLVEKLRPGFGYALTEVGQFQGYVQEYRKAG